jgi:hypothetical protein
MKNAHHVGWKNVKDYWCIIFSKALGKWVFRKLSARSLGRNGRSHERHMESSDRCPEESVE